MHTKKELEEIERLQEREMRMMKKVLSEKKSSKSVKNMDLPRKIKTLVKTCLAAPSQWEGIDLEERPIYIRYRWDVLSVRIGPEGGDLRSAVSGEEILRKECKSGYIMFPELAVLTEGVLDFSGLYDLDKHQNEIDPMLMFLLEGMKSQNED